MKDISKGEIYYADLEPVRGSEQGGVRPVLILQNNVGNKYSTTVIIAPITSKINVKTKMPTHVIITKKDGIKQDSIVLIEQVRAVDKQRILEYKGALSHAEMIAVDRAIIKAFGVEISNVKGAFDLTQEQAIIYAQLALNNLMHSANDVNPKNLKMCMEATFQLYIKTEEAEEMAKVLGYIK